MTNVPDNLREMWADIYRLFDINYKMPNTEDAWKKFWDQAVKIVDKYKNDCRFVENLVVIVSEILEEPMKIKMGVVKPYTLEDMNLF